MAILKIVKEPDPVLRARCEEVEAVTDEIRRQMDDMLETMYDAPGIGLAANQVGISNRVVVIDLAADPDKPDSEPIYMVNPVITWTSEEESTLDQGCLSAPGHGVEVKRPAKLKVEYLDYNGEKQEMKADGLMAQCVQHEIDHIDGKLIIDYLSPLKKNMVVKKLKKAKKEGLLD